MPSFSQFPAILIFLSSGLAIASAACTDISSQFGTPVPTVPASVEPQAEPDGSQALSQAAASQAPAAQSTDDPLAIPAAYKAAIDRASSAFTISQSARSPGDWQLVAGRWQQAINLMQTVPAASPYRPLAKEKVGEYQRNFKYAQQRADQLAAAPTANVPVVVSPRSTKRNDTVAASGANSSSPNGGSSQRSSSSDAPNRPGVYQAQILRRIGGTPVIEVTFNGNQTFEMIVDTGASGTLITQEMANKLGVQPVGDAKISTASANDVRFPLGYVDSVAVNGVVAQNVLVAIANPELQVGLLGQDFFGRYDLTIRENTIEFSER
ncbi:MAG: hypothetical protein F6K19_01225 [Cyanothece sp. SIO1E1]|nr:hypothetical protein [Cyanothece sp. SIO1E1]